MKTATFLIVVGVAVVVAFTGAALAQFGDHACHLGTDRAGTLLFGFGDGMLFALILVLMFQGIRRVGR